MSRRLEHEAEPNNPEAYVAYITRVMEEARATAMRKGKTETGAAALAGDAFKAALPSLTDRNSIRCYIACIAVGVLARAITADDARLLLYIAQLALAAHSHLTEKEPA